MRFKQRLQLFVVYTCIAAFSVVVYGGITWVLFKLVKELRGF